MSDRDTLLPLLKQRQTLLENLIRKVEQNKGSEVEGHLMVNKNRNHYRYYFRPLQEKGQDKPKRMYLRNIEIAKKIANRDYTKTVLRSANCELKQVKALIKVYQHSSPEDCFQQLHPGRKLLVKPYLADDEYFANEWLKKEEKRKKTNSYPMDSPIQTENQETVRSKSEKIIADKLKLQGIPYIYEMPLKLGALVKYPDFTTLNKRTRKVFYWEHMGLMDHPDYFQNAMAKLKVYHQNGIWVGKNLIVTYETVEQPLDVKMLEQIIQEYLL